MNRIPNSSQRVWITVVMERANLSPAITLSVIAPSHPSISWGTWLLGWGPHFPASVEACGAWLSFGQSDVSRSDTRRPWTSFPLLWLEISDKDRAKWPAWALDNLVSLLTYLWTAELDNSKPLCCSSHRPLDVLVTAAYSAPYQVQL